MGKKKILAISGSTKTNSTNELLLKAIARRYATDLGFEIYNRIADLPHFNPDLDTIDPPAAVKQFRKLIEISDGVLIATPEYVFSLPGALKNALEWTVSTVVFTGKPTAFIIAATAGEKAFESLNLILQTIGAKTGEKYQLLIKAAKRKLDWNGEITDEKTLFEINNLLKNFLHTIN